MWGFMWGILNHDWLAGWELSAWLKPLPGHFTGVVSAHEWYCIVGALPIPALLNGFNHWFRFSYTVLVKSVPLPLLWTPWFPWLTCLDVAVEMSCCPSHGPDPTFTLIGNKKWLGMGLKQWLLSCSMNGQFIVEHKSVAKKGFEEKDWEICWLWYEPRYSLG